MKMLTEKYMVLNLDGDEAYVRKDRLSQLRRVDAVVFDCDGALIDVRGSYNRAIAKAVAYILEGSVGCVIPESLISDEVIFLFRKSGGFNNDRDTVYGILMFMLSRLPKTIRDNLKRHIEEVGREPDPFKRFSLLEEAAGNEFESGMLDMKFFEGLIDDLKEFTELLDVTGVDSVDKNLVGGPGVSEDFIDFYDILKRFLRHPGEVGEGIVATVFEEFFCGPKLVQETYGVEPKFYDGCGMIQNEKVIIRPQALDHLAFIIGKPNLGVASGSRLKPARHVLGDLLEKFNPEALIFLNTVEKTERELSSRSGSNVNLKKPRPFSLLKAAEAFGSFNFALYVGDSMEDAIMVREARKLDDRFLFGGVYLYSGPKEVVLNSFLKSGCDLVIPSVNELPLVLEAIRRIKN